jgi:sugar phosphate isomerase/epimerase
MKIGVFTVLFRDLDFQAVLDKVAAFGLEAVEIGTGGYPGNSHCQPELLLKDRPVREQFIEAIIDRGLIISAFSCHGNPLHPDPAIAENSRSTFLKTLQLASELNVDRVCLFSGCPGEGPGAKLPNWVTCAWPPEYAEIRRWQWEEVAIPYWRQAVEAARKYGVTKIALEMHPGFLVYNPETVLNLRQAVGNEIGANVDPSHLWWQGIDPVEAIRVLGSKQAIYHFHAKDVIIDETNCKYKGVLDATPYTDVAHRSWNFRTVGYGHDESEWKKIISALRVYGYDYVLSIEHEDPLASVNEGFAKAVDFLNRLNFKESPAAIWWA